MAGFTTHILNKLDMVEWDRMFETAPGVYNIFGWIGRESDEYKDFVLVKINIETDRVVEYATSSAKHTEEIGERLGMDHSDCYRVENMIEDVDNAIELDSGDLEEES